MKRVEAVSGEQSAAASDYCAAATGQLCALSSDHAAVPLDVILHHSPQQSRLTGAWARPPQRTEPPCEW